MSVQGEVNTARASQRKVISVTANHTAKEENVILVDATAAPVTVALPPVANSLHLIFTVKKTDGTANAVTIDPDGAELLDGAANLALPAQFNRATVICDGTSWQRID